MYEYIDFKLTSLTLSKLQHEVPESRTGKLGYNITTAEGHTVWLSKDDFDKRFVDTKKMTFGAAFQCMLMGMKVTRDGWIHNSYMTIEDKKIFCHMKVNDQPAMKQSWYFNHDDVFANNWILYKDGVQ